MTPNFTPTDKQLKLAKVMESPVLLEILKKMEGGANLWRGNYGCRLSYPSNVNMISFERILACNIRTLETAGLIAPEEFDDYIEYRLTYSGTFEELVRGGKE